MARFPSRFRRLDGMLFDLPVDEAMLLSELDGYLTGIVVAPVRIAPDTWLPPIWDGDIGDPVPFDEPADAALFLDMVHARYREIERDLARGKLQPLFDIDDRNGDILWELWMDGFESAVLLRPDGWSAPMGTDAGTVAARATLERLADVAADRNGLTGPEIDRICDAAPGIIATSVPALHAWRVRQDGTLLVPPRPAAKVGRNDPCPCGSGRKSKRCCPVD